MRKLLKGRLRCKLFANRPFAFKQSSGYPAVWIASLPQQILWLFHQLVIVRFDRNRFRVYRMSAEQPRIL